MTRFLTAFAIVLSASVASAGNVFISTSSTDPTATAPLMIDEGATADLFVWFAPEATQQVNGASADIATSLAGILSATDTEVFNPTLGALGPRYNGTPSNGVLNPADGLLVGGQLGVAVTAQGLNPTLITFDDTAVDGNFLFSRITVQGDSAGTTTVSPAANPNNPITAVGQGGIDVTFTGLEVIVEGMMMADPMLVADPTSVDLSAVFADGSGVLDNGVALSNANGEFSALGTISVAIENDASGIFGASLDGENVDLTLDVAAATGLAGGIQTADLVITPEFGDPVTVGLSAAVPEPATFGLVGLTLVGLAGLRRRS